MESSYSFPQDDFALALLTHAALQSTTAGVLGSSNDPYPSSTSTAALPATISNQQSNHNPLGHITKGHLSNNIYGGHSSVENPNTMATLGFSTSSTHANGHNPYMDSAFRGLGSEISRGFEGNLGILNAETYDSAMLQRGPDERLKLVGERPMNLFGFSGAPRMEHEASEETQETPPPPKPAAKKGRKKRAVEVISADEDEDGKKKSRGRPRVDTKDETAADRRRTQIRMAQRAYRHRKETTISSLEKKVQDLRGTNEEMSNIFISLYDFAVGRSLLQREPEFGQQLQSATERFLALAKQSAEEANQEDGSEEHERHDSIPEDLEPPKKKGKRTPPKPRRELTPPPPTTQSPTWGGYTIDQSRSPIQEIQQDFHPQNYPERHRHGDLQVITRPTEDNASFPFDFMDLQPIQQYRVEVPQIEDFSQYFLPQSQLPLPRTNTYQEISFARRLLRSSLEGALRLVVQENPNPAVWKRAFGFSNQYEKKEAIKARLLRKLAGTTSDSLQNWQAPFTHVGGAGTFYPWDNTGEDLLPKFRTGYSMGPFTPEVTEIEDTMDDDMHCKMPGWEGTFFDANDVEGYLKSRGLDIPGSAETVTAQIDLSVISEVAGESLSPTNSSGSSATGLSPLTPENNGDAVVPEVESSYSLDPKKLDSEAYPFPLATPKYTKNSEIDPSFFALAGQTFAPKTPASTKKTITLNVQTLVDHLTRRGTCLGRTPGFRLSDVNAAIVAAVAAGC